MIRPYAFLCAAMLAASVVAGPSALAAKHDRGTEPLTCENGDWNGDGRASFCEVHETTLKDFGGSIDAAPGLNGGVSVRDMGELETKSAYRTRIEFFCGLAVFGNGAARLQGVLNG